MANILYILSLSFNILFYVNINALKFSRDLHKTSCYLRFSIFVFQYLLNFKFKHVTKLVETDLLKHNLNIIAIHLIV